MQNFHSSKLSFQFCLAFLLTITFLFTISAQTSETVKKLLPNNAIERQIKGGETHSFNFDVGADFYARAEVEQKNIDVIVSLFAPDGRLVVAMDGRNGYLWREAVSCIAENAGAYRIEIRAYGTPERAGSYTVKLSEIRESAANDRKQLEAEAHLSLGRKFFAEGGAKYSEAVKEYEIAATIWRELGEAEREAVALTNLGWTNSNLSRNEQTIASFTRAIELFQKTKDRVGEGKAANGLGNAYYELNQYDKASEFLEKALTIRRETGDKRGVGSTLNNLGRIYWAIGQHKKALEYYEQALSIRKEVNDRTGEGYTLNNLGIVYRSLSQYEKALDNYEKSLLIVRETGDRIGESITLNNLGSLNYFLGRYEKARDFYEQSLSIARKDADKTGESETLNNLGEIYYNLGQFEKALDYYERALLVAREIKARREEAEVYGNLMFLTEKLNNPKLAIFYGKRAVNIYQKMREEVNNIGQGAQESFLAENSKFYRRLSEILISKGRIAEAEQVLTMLKEEEVFSYLRRDDQVARQLLQTASLTDQERDAVKRYDAHAESLTKIGAELGELESQLPKYEAEAFPKQARYAELKKQLADAMVAFRKFHEQLKHEFGQNDKRVESVDSDLKELLKTLRAKRTAIVSTIVGEKQLNIIVTTDQVQKPYTVNVSEKEINKLAAEFRQALTNPKIDPRPAGQKLYDILIKPIEADLNSIKTKTILWSLDGTLRYIPVAALWDKQNGYLAERFSSVILTLANRQKLAERVPDTLVWTALGVGVSKQTEGFTALTAVPDELDCIITDEQAKTVSANPKCENGVLAGKKLLDDKFTLAAFENLLGRYSVVHIASHFRLNPGNDKDSFLLLGGGGQRHFTVENLRGISLTDVELLVLSACNTATPGGERENGVEIEGFASVAQKQGAKAVIATLWSVADTSTKDLMVEFYREYDANMNKAESLRKAQEAMITGKLKSDGTQTACRSEAVSLNGSKQPDFKCDVKAPFAHPYFWSPFVLIGNWR